MSPPKYPCHSCNQPFPEDQFKFMTRANGSKFRGRTCLSCTPEATPAEVEKNKAWLTNKRETVPCASCEKVGLVLWYKKDGTECDLFSHAEKGYIIPLLNKIIANVTPRCAPCAAKTQTEPWVVLRKKANDLYFSSRQTTGKHRKRLMMAYSIAMARARRAERDPEFAERIRSGELTLSIE